MLFYRNQILTCDFKHSLCYYYTSKFSLSFLKKYSLDLRLEERIILQKIYTENSTDFTNQNLNLKIMKKSQINENLQTQRAINSNCATSCENVQIVKNDVKEKNLNSTDTWCEARVDINSQVCKNSGSLRKKQHQLMCDFCQKEFNHTGDFNKHRRKHTGEQPYTCKKCQQKFSYASNLARHQRVHSGIKPFSCEICGCTFSRKDKFSAHLATKHEALKL